MNYFNKYKRLDLKLRKKDIKKKISKYQKIDQECYLKLNERSKIPVYIYWTLYFKRLVV